MTALGYNYRLADLNCALGLGQLSKLDGWVARRRAIAEQYDKAFASVVEVQPLLRRRDRNPSWHIFPVMLDRSATKVSRDEVFAALRAENIGVNVHYLPVYLHSYYAELGYEPGLCPVAEFAYSRLLTLPIHPAMVAADVNDVVEVLKKVLGDLSRVGEEDDG